MRQVVGGRWQVVGGRRQKAEGRRQVVMMKNFSLPGDESRFFSIPNSQFPNDSIKCSEQNQATHFLLKP